MAANGRQWPPMAANGKMGGKVQPQYRLENSGGNFCTIFCAQSFVLWPQTTMILVLQRMMPPTNGLHGPKMKDLMTLKNVVGSKTPKVRGSQVVKRCIPLVDANKWERCSVLPKKQPPTTTTAARVHWWKVRMQDFPTHMRISMRLWVDKSSSAVFLCYLCNVWAS